MGAIIYWDDRKIDEVEKEIKQGKDIKFSKEEEKHFLDKMESSGTPNVINKNKPIPKGGG